MRRHHFRVLKSYLELDNRERTRATSDWNTAGGLPFWPPTVKHPSDALMVQWPLGPF
jgi:hypothetical protein